MTALDWVRLAELVRDATVEDPDAPNELDPVAFARLLEHEAEQVAVKEARALLTNGDPQ